MTRDTSSGSAANSWAPWFSLTAGRATDDLAGCGPRPRQANSNGNGDMTAMTAVGPLSATARRENLHGRGRVCVLFACTLACASMAPPVYGIEFPGRRTEMWRGVEWTLEDPAWKGNPFDVIAPVTFTHRPTGVRRKTEMFYSGQTEWKFRFTGTRPGVWTFATSSQDAELNGHTGLVIVR
ncbi:MAG TPA: DUF5060 domain-containing protein, partial [Planctomycetaceae bacterium]|nr:DUF5060 domain-containing protein [Planctomycetaceae bacterium]